MTHTGTAGSVRSYRTDTNSGGQYRIVRPSNYASDGLVHDTVYFVEILGTYKIGTGGSEKTYPLYLTSIPQTPPASDRKFEVALAASPDEDEVWFRPRLRLIGGIGPGTGDTCCSYPNETVKVTLARIEDNTKTPPSYDLDAALMTGDPIGDGCDDFSQVSGGFTAANLLRLRGATWAGTSDDTAFYYRRAPQLADNDRDGIGNFCESNWDYDDFLDGFSTVDDPLPNGHGVPGGLPSPPPQWVLDIINILILLSILCGTVSSGPYAWQACFLVYGSLLSLPLALKLRMRFRRRAKGD